MPAINSNFTSVLFLSLVGFTAAALILKLLFRSQRYSVWESLLYFPVYCLARILWRVEIYWDPRWQGLNAGEGEKSDRMNDLPPSSGFSMMLKDRMQNGAVLIANHRASVDPFFVQLAAGGRVHWMVAGEYFRHPLFGGLLRAYQAIPTRRGGADNAATKLAIKFARRGSFVGMFPEGRINRTDAPLLSIRPGAALVASKSNSPIVPIWIEGAPVGPEVYSALFMAAHVRVYVGVPIPPPSKPVPLLETKPEASFQNVMDGNEEVSNQSGKSERSLYLQWISQAMEESLRLGNRNNSTVQMAGKSWVDT